MTDIMYVVKRDGTRELVQLDKITKRIQLLCVDLNPDYVDPISVAVPVVGGLYKGITTAELDKLAADTAISLMKIHPDYGILAARLYVSNMHKETPSTFSKAMTILNTPPTKYTGVSTSTVYPSTSITDVGSNVSLNDCSTLQDMTDNPKMQNEALELSSNNTKLNIRDIKQYSSDNNFVSQDTVCGDTKPHLNHSRSSVDDIKLSIDDNSQSLHQSSQTKIPIQPELMIKSESASLAHGSHQKLFVQALADTDTLYESATVLTSSEIEDETTTSQINVRPYTSPLNGECFAFIMEHAEFLDNIINDNNDYMYSYFGLKTLEKSYLLRKDNVIVERPQYLLLRVAIAIHRPNLELIKETYFYMSKQYFIHATPTLFSACTRDSQLSSCFLLTMKDDSITGIFDTIKDCALISKAAGGIGLNVHKIRATGAPVANNGTSNGLVPMLRVLNNVARYVDQGGGKRPGAFAIYIEPWHADIFDFLNLKKNTGKEDLRARELFYGLWIPDLFMHRVQNDENWSLMCPHKCPGLDDVWGRKFEQLYTKYENAGMANKTIKARDLWFAIIESQIETGTPYLLYKDACNAKSNQQNLGTIKCSNLCTEIVEYSSPSEIAVCNLASIALNRFVEFNPRTKIPRFNFKLLYTVTKIITINLNKVIDITSYPVKEAETSNLKHRPIGIGVQGLADTFMLMRKPFDSDEARLLNQEIFETIYYAALETSAELAAYNQPYSTFEGSPASKGILQFDMWNKTPTSLWPWADVKSKIARFGLRNSLLVAPMPTASTAQILGNTESTEPYTSNIYTRRVLSGEFTIVNQHLLKDLVALKIWTPNMQNKLIAHRGSIQNIPEIPQHLKNLYKTVWEIPVKTLINLAVDRGAFIDQSQSFSLFVAEPTYTRLSSIHFYGWKMGLKTGCYYLRTQPAAHAIQFTVQKNETTINPSNKTAIPDATLYPVCIKGPDCSGCGA